MSWSYRCRNGLVQILSQYCFHITVRSFAYECSELAGGRVPECGSLGTLSDAGIWSSMKAISPGVFRVLPCLLWRKTWFKPAITTGVLSYVGSPSSPNFTSCGDAGAGFISNPFKDCTELSFFWKENTVSRKEQGRSRGFQLLHDSFTLWLQGKKFIFRKWDC